jgi:hypothetical protein
MGEVVVVVLEPIMGPFMEKTAEGKIIINLPPTTNGPEKQTTVPVEALASLQRSVAQAVRDTLKLSIGVHYNGAFCKN